MVEVAASLREAAAAERLATQIFRQRGL